jgi:hypothetical protein
MSIIRQRITDIGIIVGGGGGLPAILRHALMSQNLILRKAISKFVFYK